MKKLTRLFVTSILAVLLSHAGAYAGFDGYPFSKAPAQSKIIKVSVDLTCSNRCTRTFAKCRNDVKYDCDCDDPTYWQHCSSALQACHSNCINNFHCIKSGGEVVCP